MKYIINKKWWKNFVITEIFWWKKFCEEKSFVEKKCNGNFWLKKKCDTKFCIKKSKIVTKKTPRLWLKKRNQVVTKLKYLNFDKAQQLFFWQDSKPNSTQSLKKLETPIIRILTYSYSDKTKEIQLWRKAISEKCLWWRTTWPMWYSQGSLVQSSDGLLPKLNSRSITQNFI